MRKKKFKKYWHSKKKRNWKLKHKIPQVLFYYYKWLRFLNSGPGLFLKSWKASLVGTIKKLREKRKNIDKYFKFIKNRKLKRKQFAYGPGKTWNKAQLIGFFRSTYRWFLRKFLKKFKYRKFIRRLSNFKMHKRIKMFRKQRLIDNLLPINYTKYKSIRLNLLSRLMNKKRRFKIWNDKVAWNLYKLNNNDMYYSPIHNNSLKAWFTLATGFKEFYGSLFDKTAQLKLTRTYLRLRKRSFKNWSMIQRTLPVLLWRANYVPSITMATWFIENGLFTVDFAQRPTFNKFFSLEVNQKITIAPTLSAMFVWWFIKQYFSNILLLKKLPSHIFTPKCYKYSKKKYFIFIKLIEKPTPINMFYFKGDMPKKFLQWFIC